MTAVGVFGTFLGVFLGLWSFDSDNPFASISPLLEGLQFAFITSVFGMGSGLLFRFFSTATAGSDNVGPSEIYNVLLSIQKEAETQSLEATAQSNSLNRLREAVENFTEGISKPIAEAIKTAIEGLEEAVNRLLASKFDALKTSIDNLNSWQKTHKQHIEELEQRIKSTADNLRASAQSLAEIVETMKEIPDALANINPSLEELKATMTVFSQLLDKIARTEEEAKKALSSINEDLKGAVDKINALPSSVQGALKESVQELAARVGAISSQLVKDYSDYTNSIKQIIQIASKTGTGGS